VYQRGHGTQTWARLTSWKAHRAYDETEARLVMVGDGSEQTSAVHRARCLGVYDPTTFLGKQPRIVD